jgi:hypothetical protein
MNQIRQISKKNLQIARFLLLVPVGSQKYRKDFILSYLHISTCGQIWLNHFPDDSHLGYITKLEKETPGPESSSKSGKERGRSIMLLEIPLTRRLCQSP